MKFISIILFASSFLFSNTVLAELTFGIGTTISDEPEIYIPIMTTNYLFEANFSRKYNKDTAGSDSPIISREIKYDKGIGAFRKYRYSNDPKSYMYYGLRYGVENRDYETNATRYKLDTEYRSISIGAVYEVTKRLTIGIDAALKYTDSTGDSVNKNSSVKTNLEEKEHYFDTKFIIRYVLYDY